MLGLNRASFHYQAASESVLNLQLMRLIDEQFLRATFYGWLKTTANLRRLGYAINGKRVRRLVRLMDIQAIYPRRSSSSPAQGHKLNPYLLRKLSITHVKLVWMKCYQPELLIPFTYIPDCYDRRNTTWPRKLGFPL